VPAWTRRNFDTPSARSIQLFATTAKRAPPSTAFIDISMVRLNWAPTRGCMRSITGRLKHLKPLVKSV